MENAVILRAAYWTLASVSVGCMALSLWYWWKEEEIAKDGFPKWFSLSVRLIAVCFYAIVLVMIYQGLPVK